MRARFPLPMVAVAVAIAMCASRGTAQTSGSASADLSFVSASGNSSMQTVTLGDRATRTVSRWTLTQTGRYIYGSANGKQTTGEFQVSGRIDLSVTARSSLFLSVADERNTFAGFRARTDQAFGVDVREISGPSDTLTMDLGAQYTEESDDDGTRLHYPAGRTGATYKHAFTHAAYFLQTAEFIPDFRAHRGRRVNAESVVVAPITTRVALKVDYSVRYDSRPPVGYGTTDRMLTTGVQVTY